MDYACNRCEKVRTIRAHTEMNTTKCEHCGMMYYEENKEQSGESTDGSTSETAGLQVPDLRGQPKRP